MYETRFFIRIGPIQEEELHMERLNYRRQYKSDTWHWCRNCPDWPKEDYTIRHYRPTRGRLCEKCRKLEDDGSCEK